LAVDGLARTSLRLAVLAPQRILMTVMYKTIR